MSGEPQPWSARPRSESFLQGTSTRRHPAALQPSMEAQAREETSGFLPSQICLIISWNVRDLKAQLIKQLDAGQQYLGQSETSAHLSPPTLPLSPTPSLTSVLSFSLISQYPFLNPASSPQPLNSGSHHPEQALLRSSSLGPPSLYQEQREGRR